LEVLHRLTVNGNLLFYVKLLFTGNYW